MCLVFVFPLCERVHSAGLPCQIGISVNQVSKSFFVLSFLLFFYRNGLIRAARASTWTWQCHPARRVSLFLSALLPTRFSPLVGGFVSVLRERCNMMIDLHHRL